MEESLAALLQTENLKQLFGTNARYLNMGNCNLKRAFCWFFTNTECTKMHGMNNIKITNPRSEVHMTVLLCIQIFCHVTPCHQVSNSQHLQGLRSLKFCTGSFVGWNSVPSWIFQSCQQRVTIIKIFT